MANESIAARYYIRLKNVAGAQVAIFDNWASLEFTKEVNGVGSFRITWVDNDDPRFDLFVLDGQVEIWRSAPGMSLDWYLEFEGFHRGETREIGSDGKKLFTSYGVGYNDLLARRTIAYRSGTSHAEKNDYSEDVMKEYVIENAGASANDADRIVNGVFTGFATEAESAEHDHTPTWTGDRSFQNLLETLQEISQFSHLATAPSRAVDFAVVGSGAALFTFRTYLDQLGTDRTAGTANPVVFSTYKGSLQDSNYNVDRTKEANVVIVLGQGDRSTRTVIYREDAAAKGDSTWNQREIARPATQNTFTYQLQDFGEATLQENYFIETVEGTPMQIPGCFYGKHYFLGDMVVVEHEDVSMEKKILSVSIGVSGQTQKEDISLAFGDIA